MALSSALIPGAIEQVDIHLRIRNAYAGVVQTILDFREQLFFHRPKVAGLGPKTQCPHDRRVAEFGEYNLVTSSVAIDRI